MSGDAGLARFTSPSSTDDVHICSLRSPRATVGHDFETNAPWVTCGRRHGKNFLTFLQHWSGARKATFLHYRLARPPTSVCRTSGLRSWTAGPSIVCLKTNQRPLWASGILLYLPTHRASEHRSLLLRGPVFLFDVTVTPQHIHRPRSPSGGMMSLA